MVSTDGGTDYTPLVQLQRIEPGGSKQTVIDQTNLTTPGNTTQPYPVQVDSGEWDCEGLLNPSDTVTLSLAALHASCTIADFKVVMPDEDESIYTFQAMVSEFKPLSIKANKLIGYSFKLRVVGGVTFPS
jgi:hypothetical protein